MDWWNKIKERVARYRDIDEAREWLKKNQSRVSALFNDYSLRDFVFEPFKGVFQTPAKTIDANIYSAITIVAIVNAVIAGLPGKMGVGVAVSMAFEGWMAYCIARHVGVKVEKPSDIWQYFGMLAVSAVTILYGFRVLLGFGFSLFSVIPGVNPLIFAEIFVTDLVGILFWVGFQEVYAERPFSIPKRLLMTVRSQSVGLFKHQMGFLKGVFSLKNLRNVYERLKAFLSGDFPVDMKIINGEVFSTAAMTYLISGNYQRLDGPLGEIFIQAIRSRWSSQFSDDTTIEQIAERFREYDAEQLEGAINTVKGKMFEIMVTQQENLDGDEWTARMHDDESFPGSDIIFANNDTGEHVEISLKSVSEGNTQTIDYALARYPNTPIMATDEVALLYDNQSMVLGSGISDEYLAEITESNVETLIGQIEPLNQYQVVIGGVTFGSAAALWPFVMAYLRKTISQDQLQEVFQHVLGQSGVALTSRIAYAAVFGPLFAWYLLARGVKGLVVMAEPVRVTNLEFRSI